MITKSPLGYPGGKANLSGFLRGLIERNVGDGCTYFELYAGGAGAAIDLLLGGDVHRIVLNDAVISKHIVKLTDILPNRDDHTGGDYVGAHLISGRGARPPEDDGGVDSYADMLKSLSDPKNEERVSYLKWTGRDFDPEFFDLHELQNRVDDFQRVIGEAG